MPAQYDANTFLVRAKEIHGDKYDYSHVEFKSASDPVTIVCPIHGEFVKKPYRHLAGSGCPRCSKIEAEKKRQQTMLERYGATTFAGSDEAKLLHEDGGGPWSKAARAKAAGTCVERFGAKTWAESEIGIATARDNTSSSEVRQKMSERAKSKEAREHYAQTCQAHHGANHWAQSDAGRKKLHEMFSTDEERRARSERMKSPEVQGKIQATSIERYGTPYYWQSPEARVRLKVLLSQSEVQQKIIATKKRRGTLNSSKAEKTAYAMLVEKFGKANVEAQYKTDPRYPYACDFYVRSLDLFIELNASWLHGFHWFDETSEADLIRLNEVVEKAEQGKPMYQRMVYIWTYDDLRKRATAEENGLNYLVFWDNDLTDFKQWIGTL